MKQSDILRAKLDEKATAATKLCDKVDTGGTLTASEEAELKRLVADVEATGAELRAQTELENSIRVARAATINAPGYTPSDPNFGPIDGSGARVVTPRLAVFKGPEAARDSYDASLWLRGVVLKDSQALAKLESRRPAWLASQSEYNPQAGGYAVPPEFHRSIIQYLDETGVARKLPTVLPMGSDNMSVPKLTAGVTTYIVGEETAITDSSQTFGQVTLEPKKRACLTYISSELNDDNAVGLMDLTAQRMALSMALQADSEFINGDGTSTYGGIVGLKTKFVTATAGVVAAATGNDTWPEITFADIAKMMSAVASKYRTGELAFLCSTSFKWQVLDRLSLAQGGALMQTMNDGVRSDLFAGYPVYTSDYCPTTTAANTICLYFGNFKQSCLFGDRQTLRLAVSEHVAFTTDQVAVRCTTRYDINNHEFGNASTAGGVVALKTAS